MRLKWSRKALKQFRLAHEHIAQENPIAAQAVAERIADATKLLLTQPKMGRSGRVKGTQEWVVKQTPYIVVYRISGNELQIARVIHSKQLWPKLRSAK